MLHQIENKIRENQRITPEEGLFLYEKAELGFLGMMAELVKQRKSGNEVYYILNFHIEPTNICINKCNFCSYSHHFSPMQWDLPVEEMLQTVRQQEPEVKEVHITGAVHPDKDLFYYADLLRRIKQVRPDLHVKALSAVELDYIAKKANLTYKKALQFLKEA
ncbi:MAG: radical SAM protein, partial [Syntrophothermus sp.]